MKIARRTVVRNIREIWPHETAFSDWLLTEDGRGMISEDIGIDVSNLRREACPGDFYCDLVGNDAADERHVVVIENQFGRTDHDHLGKLLTYTAVHGAMTGIWIAEKVANDHRKVIDWINENTPESVALFVAELKAYQIGDSPVAPELRAVCSPNRLVKPPRISEPWRNEFWRDIHAYLEQRGVPYRLPRSAEVGPVIGIGRLGFHMYLGARFAENRMECGVVTKGPHRDEAFRQLQQTRAEIEGEIGTELTWRPGGRYPYVRLGVSIELRTEENRGRIKEWLYETSIKFYNVFKPRIEALRLPEQDSDLGDAGGPAE